MTTEEIDGSVARYSGIIQLAAMTCRLASEGRTDEEVVRLVRAFERRMPADPRLVIGASEAVAKSVLEAWRRLQ